MHRFAPSLLLLLALSAVAAPAVPQQPLTGASKVMGLHPEEWQAVYNQAQRAAQELRAKHGADANFGKDEKLEGSNLQCVVAHVAAAILMKTFDALRYDLQLSGGFFVAAQVMKKQAEWWCGPGGGGKGEDLVRTGRTSGWEVDRLPTPAPRPSSERLTPEQLRQLRVAALLSVGGFLAGLAAEAVPFLPTLAL